MSVPATFGEMLEDRRIHVIDGAMGTVLYSRGVFVNVCYDALVLDEPDMVRRVHADYVRAGAELLETNTFGANPIKLSAHGLDERTVQNNRHAAKLAMGGAAGRALVLGSIGPLGIGIAAGGASWGVVGESYVGPRVDGVRAQTPG